MGSEPVQADIAKSSPSLPASSRATAAFVLDYLQHNGYTKAFGSARSEMSRRSWVPPPGSESVPCEKLVAINQINRVLAEPESHVPLDRIESLLPVTSPLHHRMSIYQLVHLVQCAHAAKDEDQEMEAIAYGRDLRARAKHQPWAVGECDLLDEAVGHLGLEFDDASRTKWAERRARDSDLLDSHLRCESFPTHFSERYFHVMSLTTLLSRERPACAVATRRGYRPDRFGQQLAGPQRTSIGYVPQHQACSLPACEVGSPARRRVDCSVVSTYPCIL